MPSFGFTSEGQGKQPQQRDLYSHSPAQLNVTKAQH